MYPKDPARTLNVILKTKGQLNVLIDDILKEVKATAEKTRLQQFSLMDRAVSLKKRVKKVVGRIFKPHLKETNKISNKETKKMLVKADVINESSPFSLGTVSDEFLELSIFLLEQVFDKYITDLITSIINDQRLDPNKRNLQKILSSIKKSMDNNMTRTVVTETTKVYIKARTDIFEKYEITKHTWVTVGDGRVCKFCAPLNNKTVKVGSPFAYYREFGHVYAPGFHPRCRCNLIMSKEYYPLTKSVK